jgi:hypothetical protein
MAAARFPGPPPAPPEGTDSPLESLLAGGAGAAALARGVGRLLGVVERKEVRAPGLSRAQGLWCRGS